MGRGRVGARWRSGHSENGPCSGFRLSLSVSASGACCCYDKEARGRGLKPESLGSLSWNSPGVPGSQGSGPRPLPSCGFSNPGCDPHPPGLVSCRQSAGREPSLVKSCHREPGRTATTSSRGLGGHSPRVNCETGEGQVLGYGWQTGPDLAPAISCRPPPL